MRSRLSLLHISMNLKFFMALLLSLSVVAFGVVPGEALSYRVDLSATNLPPTYGAAANLYASPPAGRNNICGINGSGTKIYLTTSSVANCAGAASRWPVPANNSACYDRTRINTYVCAKSESGTVTSGIIDLVIW